MQMSRANAKLPNGRQYYSLLRNRKDVALLVYIRRGYFIRYSLDLDLFSSNQVYQGIQIVRIFTGFLWTMDPGSKQLSTFRARISFFL